MEGCSILTIFCNFFIFFLVIYTEQNSHILVKEKYSYTSEGITPSFRELISSCDESIYFQMKERGIPILEMHEMDSNTFSKQEALIIHKC